MNWSYQFGKQMVVTDQHKKYWHITDYESNETSEKGYIVDTLDKSDIDSSTFLMRNPSHKVGTIESATFNWSEGKVDIKRYEGVYKLKAPTISLNGSTTTNYSLLITNDNDPLAPTLAPTATFHSQDLGDTTYDIKPGESVILEFTWDKEADVPESKTFSGYFDAFHCDKSETTRFTFEKTVVPKDLTCTATCVLDTSTGAYKYISYKLTNPNDYEVIFKGTFKLDDTVLMENFTVPASGYVSQNNTTDGYKLTLDGVVRANTTEE